MKPTARVLVIPLLLLAAGCAARATPTAAPTATPLPAMHLTIAVAPAAQGYLRQWTQGYAKEQSFIVVDVLSADAPQAEAELAEGKVDAAILDQELPASYAGVLTATRVVNEPIAVLVHPGNPLRDLTTPDVAELFTGRIMEWSQVGGAAVPVQIYLQAEPAGEVLAFAAEALAGQRLAPQAIICASPASVLASVARDPGALAILPASQVPDGTAILRADGLLPGSDNYPWQIPILLAYGPSSPIAAHMFIQFVLGEGGENQ